jgi:C1A family cysteine protease
MAAVNLGAVSVGVEADQYAFQHYTGGVIDDKYCGTLVDHAVVVVGYTSNSFIVRNSWGPFWGEKGYV